MTRNSESGDERPADPELPTAAMSVQDVADVRAPLVEPLDTSTQAMTSSDFAEVLARVERPTELFPAPHRTASHRGADTGARPAGESGDLGRDTSTGWDSESGGGGDPASPIDALFSPDNFHEGVSYTSPRQPGSDARANTSRTETFGTATSAVHRTPGSAIPPHQRTLLLVAGALVLVLALIGLYLLGIRMGAQSAEAASAVAAADALAAETPAPAPPAPPVAATGPLEPGVHAWDAMLGGECLGTFDTPWAEEFTVVGCDAEHVAQLYALGQLGSEPGSPYPGADALAAEARALCTAPAALNYAAVGAVADMQLSVTFPPDEAAWATDGRTYRCFAARSSEEPLPGDLMVPPPT